MWYKNPTNEFMFVGFFANIFQIFRNNTVIKIQLGRQNNEYKFKQIPVFGNV